MLKSPPIKGILHDKGEHIDAEDMMDPSWSLLRNCQMSDLLSRSLGCKDAQSSHLYLYSVFRSLHTLVRIPVELPYDWNTISRDISAFLIY